MAIKMQKKTKYSILILISVLVIGAPAYLLSNTEKALHSAKNASLSIDKEQTKLTTEPQKQDKSRSPVTGIHSIIAKNKEQADANQHNEYLSPIERIQAIENKNELHESLLKDHEQFSRYAEYNKAFEDTSKDPVVKRYEVEERTTQSQEDETSLTIWSDKKYYLPGEQATVFASLRNSEGQAVPTTFVGQLIYNEKTNLQTFQFTDQNQDGIYENTLSLTGSVEQSLGAGLYKVLVVNNKNKVSDALTFILSEPEIKLTGNFKDSVTANGELLIQAEVSVSEKNRFYLQASLYSANKIPIGATQQALELTKGKHWVNLLFDGRMIKDSGESGSYLLKNISLAKVTVPMQRAPLDSAEYFTKDYSLEQFKSSNAAQDDNLQAQR